MDRISLRRILAGDTFTGRYSLIVLAQPALLASPFARPGRERPRFAWGVCVARLAGTILFFAVASRLTRPAGESMRAALSLNLSVFVPWASFVLAEILLGLSAARGGPVPIL